MPKQILEICQSDLKDILAKVFKCEKDNIYFVVTKDQRNTPIVSARVVDFVSLNIFTNRDRNKAFNEENE